jgi:hypothetical protein
MKRICLYIVLLSLLGVALYYWLNNHKSNDAVVDIDPRLQKYIDEWQEDLNAEGVDTKSVFISLRSICIKNIPDDKVGVSYYYKRTIEIDPVVLNRGEYSMRGAIYHELGHFAFGLEHESCQMMSTRILSEEVYKNNWDEMKKEYITLLRKQNFETHLP